MNCAEIVVYEYKTNLENFQTHCPSRKIIIYEKKARELKLTT